MAKIYEWGSSPIRDFLLQIMLLDNDITDLKYNDGITDNINFMLAHMGVDRHDLLYLDFKFKEPKKGHVRVIPNNIVCAMWFIGALPNCDRTFKNNYAYFNDRKYKFNKKTKRLTWERIKK